MEELQRLRETQLERENAEKWSDLHATFTTVQPARARHFYFSSAWQRCKWEIQLPNDHKRSSKANNNNIDNYI